MKAAVILTLALLSFGAQAKGGGGGGHASAHVSIASHPVNASASHVEAPVAVRSVSEVSAPARPATMASRLVFVNSGAKCSDDSRKKDCQ